MAQAGITLENFWAAAASGNPAPIDPQRLFEAASVFGDEKAENAAVAEIAGQKLGAAAAKLKLEIEACRISLNKVLGCQAVAGGETADFDKSLSDLLRAAAVLGGCRSILRSIFEVGAARPRGRAIRQSLEFRLVGLQAEQEAVTALLVETLGLLLSRQPLNSAVSSMLLKAVVEHLVKIQALEPVILLSGEGFEPAFVAKFRSRQRLLLSAVVTLFPEGVGAAATEPVALQLGL